MCTAVIDVTADGVTHLLAVRDEDPGRAWDGLAEWWPEQYPGVVGIRDRRAGGAWLAFNPAMKRVAVILNRADVVDVEDAQTRGSLVLESVSGRSAASHPRMHGFNLIEISSDESHLLSWDGSELIETPIPEGVHMIAHEDLNDPLTPRIVAWRDAFREAATRPGYWPDAWLDVLADSARLSPEDDRAIIRDNNAHGYPTQSLLYALASVSSDSVSATDAVLPAPARWL